MVDKTRLEELHTQIGLVHDIIRHTDVKDPRMESLRELLATMYQKLNEMQPPKERLERKLLSEDSL
jgi:hypothetical protein